MYLGTYSSKHSLFEAISCIGAAISQKASLLCLIAPFFACLPKSTLCDCTLSHLPAACLALTTVPRQTPHGSVSSSCARPCFSLPWSALPCRTLPLYSAAPCLALLHPAPLYSALPCPALPCPASPSSALLRLALTRPAPLPRIVSSAPAPRPRPRPRPS